jgi:hypothetical protein
MPRGVCGRVAALCAQGVDGSSCSFQDFVHRQVSLRRAPRVAAHDAAWCAACSLRAHWQDNACPPVPVVNASSALRCFEGVCRSSSSPPDSPGSESPVRVVAIVVPVLLCALALGVVAGYVLRRRQTAASAGEPSPSAPLLLAEPAVPLSMSHTPPVSSTEGSASGEPESRPAFSLTSLGLQAPASPPAK